MKKLSAHIYVFFISLFNNFNLLRILQKNKKRGKYNDMFIRSRFINASANDNAAIFWACDEHKYKIVKTILLFTDIDPSTQYNRLIKHVCKQGKTGLAGILLKDPRVDPTVDSQYCIRMASLQGHFKLVKFLLKDPRVDPTGNDDCLEYAFRHGDNGTIRILLNHPNIKLYWNERPATDWCIDMQEYELLERLYSNNTLSPVAMIKRAVRSRKGTMIYTFAEKIITKTGIDPSGHNNVALVNALLYKNVFIAKLLLKNPFVKINITPTLKAKLIEDNYIPTYKSREINH